MHEKDIVNANPPVARLDSRLANWMARHGLTMLRLALGIVFLWFGGQKFFPALSEAETLAIRTIDKLSFGMFSADTSRIMLAIWECLIGLGLLSGRFMRLTLGLLFLQMIGTFLPLAFFPDETWKYPFVPTLVGQYIIKNGVLVSAGIVLGATVRGGKLIADPKAAREAERKQAKAPSDASR